MKKLLLLSTALVALGLNAPAQAKQTHYGWIKSSDFTCMHSVHECFVVDHYTEVQKRGDDCAMFAVPVYDRPNGKIVKAAIADVPFDIGEVRGDFTRIKSEEAFMPPGDFSECG